MRNRKHLTEAIDPFFWYFLKRLCPIYFRFSRYSKLGMKQDLSRLHNGMLHI